VTPAGTTVGVVPAAYQSPTTRGTMMSRESRSKREANRNGRRYDAEMIRDFLDHLLWEVRILHYESTATPGAINPELLDTIASLQSKYPGTACLLAATYLTNDRELSGEQVARAEEYWRKARAQASQGWVDALEHLQGLFREALECVSKFAGQVPARHVDAFDVLPAEEGGNPDSPLTR
jgi:hypothetical protein